MHIFTNNTQHMLLIQILLSREVLGIFYTIGLITLCCNCVCVNNDRGVSGNKDQLAMAAIDLRTHFFHNLPNTMPHAMLQLHVCT